MNFWCSINVDITQNNLQKIEYIQAINHHVLFLHTHTQTYLTHTLSLHNDISHTQQHNVAIPVLQELKKVIYRLATAAAMQYQ